MDDVTIGRAEAPPPRAEEFARGDLRARHPRLELATQFVLILGAALVYFLVRGLTQGETAEAIAHSHQVLRLEGLLGLDVEQAAQADIVDHRWLVTGANWVYIWGHWPVIAITLFGLHRSRTRDYLLLRNAMFVSGAIGIVIFIVYPVAPPRLFDDGYVDTVTELSRSYRVLQPPALVNKYAAMPSLHVGWNLLVGVVVFRVTQSLVLRVLAVTSPVLMGIAVVLTANHYVLDGLVGCGVALLGLAGAHLLERVAYARPLLEVRSYVGQQVEIVEDEPRHTKIREVERAGEVGHGPRKEQTVTTEKSRDDVGRQETLVNDRALKLAPPSDVQQQVELRAVARGSQRASAVERAEGTQEPPGTRRHDQLPTGRQVPTHSGRETRRETLQVGQQDGPRIDQGDHISERR